MTHTDYERIMTSVLTPLEYCACGFTETEAFQYHGASLVDVYHAPIRNEDACPSDFSEHAIVKALFLKPERVNYFILNRKWLKKGFFGTQKKPAFLPDFFAEFMALCFYIFRYL
jgi:hypothetical protein